MSKSGKLDFLTNMAQSKEPAHQTPVTKAQETEKKVEDKKSLEKPTKPSKATRPRKKTNPVKPIEESVSTRRNIAFSDHMEKQILRIHRNLIDQELKPLGVQATVELALEVALNDSADIQEIHQRLVNARKRSK